MQVFFVTQTTYKMKQILKVFLLIGSLELTNFSKAYTIIHLPTQSRQCSKSSNLFTRRIGERSSCLQNPVKTNTSRGDFSKCSSVVENVSDSIPIQTESVRAETKSFLERIDSAGLRLKTKALASKSKAMATDISGVDKIIETIKACALISLFILYRAYRGFFVILPQVFRRVYDILGDSVDPHPFEDEEIGVNGDGSAKKRKRTTFTVSILASILTVSYVLGGAFRVVKSFLDTAITSKNIMYSFEAAGDEVVSNEGKILKRIARMSEN